MYNDVVYAFTYLAIVFSWTKEGKWIDLHFCHPFTLFARTVFVRINADGSKTHFIFRNINITERDK